MAGQKEKLKILRLGIRDCDNSLLDGFNGILSFKSLKNSVTNTKPDLIPLAVLNLFVFKKIFYSKCTEIYYYNLEYLNIYISDECWLRIIQRR